jgi:hypothetical protein
VLDTTRSLAYFVAHPRTAAECTTGQGADVLSGRDGWGCLAKQWHIFDTIEAVLAPGGTLTPVAQRQPVAAIIGAAPGRRRPSNTFPRWCEALREAGRCSYSFGTEVPLVATAIWRLMHMANQLHPLEPPKKLQ